MDTMDNDNISIVVFLIFAIVVAGIAAMVYFRSKGSTPSHKPRRRASTPHFAPEPVPSWLTEELEKYQRSALSYAFYELSLDERYAAKAKLEMEKLGDLTFAPPPLLLSHARKNNNCTCEQLDKWLLQIYTQKTGSSTTLSGVQQRLEDTIIAFSKKKALEICS